MAIFHRFIEKANKTEPLNKTQETPTIPAEPNPTETPHILNNVVDIPTAEIIPNPAQPRIIFDDYELSQLAVSIRQNGILQPLTVRKVERVDCNSDCSSDNGESRTVYELIAGERRLRAAKLAGFESVPCIVMEATCESSAVLAIMENIQRSDLNYIEEAYAISRLIAHLGLTQEAAALKLGIAQSTVANKLRLLKLSDEEKSAVLRYGLNERQARALLKLPAELRFTAIERIATEGLNTVATDKLVEALLAPPTTKRAVSKHSFEVKQTALYINTLNRTIDLLKKSGLACTSKQSRTDEYVEYVVRIPLK